MPALRALRMRAQGLAGPPASGVAEAVRAAGAIQAQDTPSSRLGVRARSVGLRVDDVVRACDQERSVVRTWAMRGTIHMIPIEDARWMTALLGPTHAARYARRRRELGIDDDLAERALAAMGRILAGRGPLLRDELMDAIEASGVPLDRSGQMPAHLIYLAAFRGLVCRGPDPAAGGGSTVALADDWLPPGAPRELDAALEELALRFVRAYGAVGARDLAYWSGLPAAMARRGMESIGGRLTEVASPCGPLWILGAPPEPGEAPPGVRLVPAFDGALLGHRDRTPLMGDRAFAEVTAGSWILPTVLAGGRIVATWRPRWTTGAVSVEVTPLEPLDEALLPDLRTEAEDVGRFLGLTPELEILTP
jgi:hypothetical protein